jgi:hypothetical protein
MGELEITIENAWQRTGRKQKLSSILDHLNEVPEGEFGLVLLWDPVYSYVQVDLLVNSKPLPSVLRNVLANDARRFVQQHGLDPAQFQGVFGPQNRSLLANVSRATSVQLCFTLDTDSDLYCSHTDQMDEAHRYIPFNLLVIANGTSDEYELHLVLDRAQPVEEYRGYVALDIGNSTTTLVLLPSGNNTADRIRIVDGNRTPGTISEKADPVPSHVRIDRLAPPNSYGFSRAEWVIGTTASGGQGRDSVDGLILGPKRLLSGRSWSRKQRIFAYPWSADPQDARGNAAVANARVEMEISNRLPAELLTAQLLQRFREATNAFPSQLALTYPTGYSSSECEQLRQTVYRGWLRASGIYEADEEQIAHYSREVVPLLIDEASAAAFYFLYRRIFGSPGGLMRFRYLYPAGLNLLLYDCGGGTTDIALVNASVDPQVKSLLRVRVMGRSGVRDFGGDNITEAVFSLLKAKLALKCAELRGDKNRPAWPAVDREALQRYLADHASWIDSWVPTRFDPKVPGGESRTRRKNMLDLWRLAERLKREFTPERGTVKLADIGLNQAAIIREQLDTLWPSIEQRFASDQNRIRDLPTKIGEIELAQEEIDCLIQDKVQQTIDRANHLIQTKLTPKRQMVGWVVITGNASRYPMIRRELTNGLEVPFIERPERLTLEVENLKHSVAKGAVLALMVKQAMRQVQVEFDSDLSNRLPYSITYPDPISGQEIVMFREHERYEDLSAFEVELSNGSNIDMATNINELQLRRLWPGEEVANVEPFLQFRFPQGATDKIIVAYDEKEAEFTARDTRNTAGERIQLIDDNQSLPPVQRGDL